MGAPVVEEIREVIDASPVKAGICGLNVRQAGKGKCACIVSLVAEDDVSPEYFRQQLGAQGEMVRAAVEVNRHAVMQPPSYGLPLSLRLRTG